jgi:uncharacterized protein with FMN-binding domain
MKERVSNKQVANRLMAVSSAAVMAVYAAGYTRTRSAAEHLAGRAALRRPSVPRAPQIAPPVAETPVATPAPVAAALPVQAPAAEAAPAVRKPVVSRMDEAVAPWLEHEPAPAVAPPVAAPVLTPVVTPVVAPVAAVPPPPPAAPPAAPPAPVWKDGTYTGWGTSRHGDIQASVVIEGGRIASATIAQCMTRYSCSVIETLPPQVAQRQSPETDLVSGATQSTDAFYFAVVEALSKAK